VIKDYRTVVAENRRLALLRFLASDADYAMNDSVIQTALGSIGHGVSRDVVRGDFSWLAEQGLVRVEVVMDKIHVATITARGLDVASGCAIVPGVARPGPEG
jgi:hypothetical protein